MLPTSFPMLPKLWVGSVGEADFVKICLKTDFIVSCSKLLKPNANFQSLSVRCLLRQNLSGNKIDALITVPENFPRNICLGNCKSENLCLFGKILTSL